MRLPALLLVTLIACTDGGSSAGPSSPHDFPVGEGGKEDVFGRALAGVAAPYEADFGMRDQEARIQSEMAFRRQIAWEIVGRSLDPVPLLGLAGLEGETVTLPDGEVPQVPRFQTWYGVDDFKRMFQYLYESLGEEGRAARAPFDDAALAEIFEWNAAAIERSSRWPLERFIDYVNRLGVCPEGVEGDACARMLQSNFSGASFGNVRITYSPATIMHLLRSYPRILECMDQLETLSLDAEPSPDNFTFCFEQEFPADAALIKAQWVRADFGMQVPTFDTGADTIARHLSPENAADWGMGERMSDPPPEDIYTIRLRNGNTFRLAGVHIMTKELRHWTWVTMWWSDQPDTDYGADRPDFIRERLDPVFSNYKMCIVADYEEGDTDPGQAFEGQPTLAAALRAAAGGPSWCSNPYIEHGRGNARSNCIGCHQHAGSEVFKDLDGDGALDPFDLEAVIGDEAQFPDTGRRQIRQVFPSDYSWAFNRVDDLSQVIRSEVDHFDFVDRDGVPARARRVLGLTGDPTAGAAIFADNCTRCHGVEGRGSAIAPNLYERVPMRDDLSIAITVIGGRSPMPAWGETFDDQTLANVIRFLRNNFDAPVSTTPAAAGDVILSEIMANPEALDDSVGEWIEIYNPTTRALDLTGCTLTDDSGSSPLDGVSVAAGGYVTFAASASPGFTPDGTISNALDNAGDILTISCGGTTIDVVDYTSFPRAFGASLSLDPSALTHTANDDGVNWCWATMDYDGDLGSPGAANPTCM